MLPIELTRYFADSLLEVESFARPGSTLAVRIEKEIGPETGVIAFSQVSFMSLPTTMPGEAIRVRPISEAGREFWARSLLEREDFDSDDLLFEIESQGGPLHFVVAKSVRYEVRAEAEAQDPAAGADSDGKSLPRAR